MIENYREIGVGYYEGDAKSLKKITSVLASGRISYGPMCKELERSIAGLHDCRYGVTSASGTDSLRAALHAMKIVNGWSDGDEVITAATTFVATVNIILQVGLKPVLVDVVPDHYTIDCSLIREAITDKTRVIIPVNLLGQAADLMCIADIAVAHDIKILEDSCEAMFVDHRGVSVGSWGDIGCFSFYMAHLITAGVGGIAITNNKEYADVMRSLLNHGRDTIYISIDDDDGLTDEELSMMTSRRFKFLYPGYSSRMTELQAALALTQLDSWYLMIQKRQEIAAALTARLSRHDQLLLPYPMVGNMHSWMMYSITVRDGSKWPLVNHLEENGVETRELLPLINQPVYDGMFDNRDYPVSRKALDSAFYIGSHQGMDLDDVEYIGEVVDYFYGG